MLLQTKVDRGSVCQVVRLLLSAYQHQGPALVEAESISRPRHAPWWMTWEGSGTGLP